MGCRFEVWEENDTVFAASLDEVDTSGNRVRLLLKDGEIIRRELGMQIKAMLLIMRLSNLHLFHKAVFKWKYISAVRIKIVTGL